MATPDADRMVWCWQCGRMMFRGDEHTHDDDEHAYCVLCCPICAPQLPLGDPHER